MKNITFVFFFLQLSLWAQKLPEGFVYLADIDPTIQSELKYHSKHNFIGKTIEGYHSNKVIITLKAALQLKKIQSILRQQGLSLKVYDAYRPQQAVNHFTRWAKKLRDTVNKARYYPNVRKQDLFKLDYIAPKSGHSRGSTVDLTIVDRNTGLELDMGSRFDFFDEISHPFYPSLNSQQKANRLLLRNLMRSNGFKPYDKEWWHFTLSYEPFPKTYFDFPVE